MLGFPILLRIRSIGFPTFGFLLYVSLGCEAGEEDEFLETGLESDTPRLQKINTLQDSLQSFRI